LNMGLRLVDGETDSGDDRAALADARGTVVAARERMQALADCLAALRGRLVAQAQDQNDQTAGAGFDPPGSGDA
jgi:ABC-type uncharacterized transport system permease subunit